jgi:transposase-like protein
VPRKKIRAYDRETKIATVKRILRGENVSALTRELKIARAVLYRWKDAYREEGTGAFRRKAGRPPKFAPGVEKARAEAAGELSAAQQRIADLERKVGQQQVELDFFRQALRQVEANRAAINGRGPKASTPSSKR